MTRSAAPNVPPMQRYSLRKRIAVGGMAEIFLATQRSPGFTKDVVIKRLRPELADDPRVLAMFRDEAAVGAHLSHPYTVHVYDVGEDNGAAYIAMEYIDGEELNQLCRRGLAVGEFLPLEHAVELMRQAAISLGHFHASRDADGRELEIVHCDISPTNLLVTSDGFVKVIDFGIVRFRGQEYPGDAAVPGKLSYMSPEQARREAIDWRSDIFSLGVVLYEITLGKRLFKGPAKDVAARLVAGEVRPPTFVNNDYPGALESIVMRALEPRREERYATAFDLADDLARFLVELDRPSGSVALARYLDRLTLAEGGTRRPELVSEAESSEADEFGDDLDFDRGAARELGASAQTAAAAAEWDEFEEDGQAVADALGIELQLVRTQIREEDADDDVVVSFVETDLPLEELELEDLEPEESATKMYPAPAPQAPQAAQALAASPLVAEPESHAVANQIAPQPQHTPLQSLAERPAFNPASSIKPLEQPKSAASIALGVVIGGGLVFLLLQLI